MPNTYTLNVIKLNFSPPFVRFLKMTAITDIQYEVGPYSVYRMCALSGIQGELIMKETELSTN